MSRGCWQVLLVLATVHCGRTVPLGPAEAPEENIPTLELLPSTLPAAQLGQDYLQTIRIAPNWKAEVVWRQPSGNLPPGLSLKPAADEQLEISGRPQQEGDFGFVLQALSDGRTIERYYQISVSSNSLEELVLDGRTLSLARPGQNYQETIQASGGCLPYNYQIFSANLPRGLKTEQSGQVFTLSGTPEQLGAFRLQVRVSDCAQKEASASFLLVVSEQKLEILTESLPTAQVGKAYAAGLEGIGPNPENLRWRILSGTSFSLRLASNEGPAVSLEGVASQVTGRVELTIELSDGSGEVAHKDFTIDVEDRLEILTDEFPDGQEGNNYRVSVQAQSQKRVQWRLKEGQLPDGLQLNPQGSPNSLLSGRPLKAGTFRFVLEASTDTHTVTKSYQLRILDGLRVSPPVLPTIYLDTQHQQRIEVKNPRGLPQWQLLDTPPEELRFLTLGRFAELSGRALREGDYPLRLQVRSGHLSRDINYLLRVRPLAEKIEIITETLPTVSNCMLANFLIEARAPGSGNYRWNYHDVFPRGLRLLQDGSLSAELIGTIELPGRHSMTISVEDGRGNLALKEY